MCYRKTPVTKISKREKLGVSAWAPPCYSFIIFFPKLLTLTQGLPWIRLFMMCSSVRAEIVHLLTGKFMAQHVMVNTVTQIGSLVFITEQLRPRHPPPSPATSLLLLLAWVLSQDHQLGKPALPINLLSSMCLPGYSAYAVCFTATNRPSFTF